MDLENLASVIPHASLVANVIPKIWCRGLHRSVRTGGKHSENMGMFMIVTDARPRGARYALVVQVDGSWGLHGGRGVEYVVG